MAQESPIGPAGSVLIIGASRGLGHAMASEFVKKDWDVVGTVLETERTLLHDLADQSDGRVQIEPLDIREQSQLDKLHTRLSDRSSFDILFVNAGISFGLEDTVNDVTKDDFISIMVTNAWSPIRAIETLQDLIARTGTIGAMTSGQGSLTNNTGGGSEVYRASKAALNMFMRSYSARQADGARSLLLMAPGWVRTDLGGPDAVLSIDESIPKLVDVLLSQRGTPGLQYLDYLGRTVPW
jgi:NAD(P)-dependent dehydrogenase (short-subunit alcohol dehydrogenase family)